MGVWCSAQGVGLLGSKILKGTKEAVDDLLHQQELLAFALFDKVLGLPAWL